MEVLYLPTTATAAVSVITAAVGGRNKKEKVECFNLNAIKIKFISLLGQ